MLRRRRRRARRASRRRARRSDRAWERRRRGCAARQRRAQRRRRHIDRCRGRRLRSAQFPYRVEWQPAISGIGGAFGRGAPRLEGRTGARGRRNEHKARFLPIQGVDRMRFASVLTAAVAAVVLAAPMSAPAAAAPARTETTRGVTKPVLRNQISEEYRVETEHGTMYGWVARPDPAEYPGLYADGHGSEGPGIPVGLKRSPYNT